MSKESMILTIADPGDGYHGWGVRLHGWVQVLEKMGYQVTIYSVVGRVEESERFGTRYIGMGEARRRWQLTPYRAIRQYMSRDAVRRIADSATRYDLVMLFGTAAAQYLGAVSGRRSTVIVDFIDAADSYAERFRSLRRRLELEAVLKFQQETAKLVRSFATTVRDAELIGGGTIEVPHFADDRLFALRGNCTDGMTFVGDMTYGPNRDAVWYIAKRILPFVHKHVPEARLDLYGRISPKMTEGLQKVGAKVHGVVAKVEMAYANKSVVLAPVQYGGGLKTKVIEGLASGVPVVTTKYANEPIGAKSGQELIVADSDQDIVSATIEMLLDRQRAKTIGEMGQQFARAKYSLEAVAQRVQPYLQSQ